MARLLFVSRAYPPVLGGIENQNRGLHESLAALVPLTAIINRRGKSALWWFLPYALVRMLLIARRHEAVLLGDGVLGPLGACVKHCFPKVRVYSVIHGLDVTFARKPGILPRLYAAVNLPALCRLDGLIAVGREPLEQAVAAGLPRARITFIPNGLFPEEFREAPDRSALERVLGEALGQRRVILQVGRFVRRKGALWFIREVLPALPADVLYVAAGAAPAESAVGDQGYLPDCRRAVEETGQTDRVRFVANAPEAVMKTLLANADLVVMPNIPDTATVEGFGLAAIEGGAAAKVVLAAGIEGLRDAVHDGQNGVLLPSGDALAWVGAVTKWLSDDARREAFGQAAREHVRTEFAWGGIARRYLEHMGLRVQ